MGAPPATLPELRPELRLFKGAASYAGEPTWLIQDPVQSRNIQIDLASFETLAHWRHARSLDELIEQVNANGRITIDRAMLEQLIAFLHQNNLTITPPRDGWRHYAAASRHKRHSPFVWLLHNYLFFRVPLWRPQRLLDATMPAVRHLGSSWVQRTILLLGLVGLYLVSRQWETYLLTYRDFVSIEGVVVTGLTLAGIKAAHELGHAYTAVHHGCRVPTMGAAFMVLAPMLYTDVSDAWKLRNRRQRMQIDSAGVRVELAIAAIALFVWPFLPEGPLKGAAFMLSAISLVTSLAINLNPFMRFDGYYLLSEILRVENLQQRAFAVGRWKLREWLFGLGHPCPEEAPRRIVVALVVYAWSVWIYRLLLFIGIALIVYHYFFKALGVLLFAVEIVFFVLWPVLSEIAMWIRLRRAIGGSRRALITAGAVMLLLVTLIAPWSTRVEIPAVVETRELAQSFPPRAARIEAVHVHHGNLVEAGDPIVTLSAPDLALERQTATAQLALARAQHDRRGADDIDREASLILEETITSLESRLRGIAEEEAELVVRSPIAGRVVELDEALHPGRWIGPREQLATIAGGADLKVHGYVGEADLWRISEGDGGRFVPNSIAFSTVPVEVAAIAVRSATEIDRPELTSINGGRIAASANTRLGVVPAQSEFAVLFTSAAPAATYGLSVRGIVIADGRPESLLSRLWRQILSVVVRESGA